MIAVTIPTYLQRGYGPMYLKQLLDSIYAQKGCDFTVCVSDNDDTGTIKKVIDAYPNIIYAYNEVKGASENINSAIEMAEATNAKRIKLMCMDDMLMRPDSLALFNQALDRNDWVIGNSVIINSRGRQSRIVNPKFEPNRFDKNTIGMPSVIAWHKAFGWSPRFDVSLKTFCDLDFYLQLYTEWKTYGYIKEVVVGQRYHPHSQSRNQPASHDTDAQVLKQRYG